jgi:hypothetical protein
MAAHPIMSAAAVRIYRPSPSGLFGTGETGKLKSLPESTLIPPADAGDT